MRGNKPKISKAKKSVDDKMIKYSAIGLSVLAVIVFALFMYSQNLNNEMKDGALSSEKIASILDSTDDFENVADAESASSSIGKSVEEANNVTNTETNSVENQTTNSVKNTTSNTTTNTTKTTTPTSATKNTTKTENTAKVESQSVENSKQEEQKELNFQKPVEGEVTRDFSKDSLVYSETLKEWVTHMGIDIKADKTTVVKAAEAGTVKTIKNDPRFGITIVIEHSNGFQTVYANLLTTEFVVEGEKVEKGQSIGTVGNTAVFEITDEPHLHFEILKDSVQVDPNLYLK